MASVCVVDEASKVDGYSILIFSYFIGYETGHTPMKSVVAYDVFGYENESRKWRYIRTRVRNWFLFVRKKKKRDTIAILPVWNNFSSQNLHLLTVQHI